METLVKLEQLGARVSIRHNIDILGGFAENDPQAARDLKSISLLLKSLTEEARSRAFDAEIMNGQC